MKTYQQAKIDFDLQMKNAKSFKDQYGALLPEGKKALAAANLCKLAMFYLENKPTELFVKK